MLEFKQYLTESVAGKSIIDTLYSFAIYDVVEQDDTIVANVTLQHVNNQRLADALDDMGLDWEFVAAEASDEDADTDVDVNDLNGDEIYYLAIYMSNMLVQPEGAIEDDNALTEPTYNPESENEMVTEGKKRVVKVNSKGKKRIKIKCSSGYRYDAGSNSCTIITGEEKRKRRLAIRKAVKTRKRKGVGAKRKSTKARLKAVKKRRQMGVKDNR